MGFFLKKNKSLVITTLTLIGFMVILFTGSTVVSNEDMQANADGPSASSTDFNAEEYVEETWESEVLPYFEDNKRDIMEIFNQINEKDLAVVGEELGVKDGSSFNFIVAGKGEVVSVNTESRKGVSEIDVEPYDGSPDFTLQIGPVFEGYAIRDVLDYIKFEDFNNQIEWAQLGTTYNTKSYQDNLEGIELKEGLEISYTGVLTASEEVSLLTPVLVRGGGE